MPAPGPFHARRAASMRRAGSLFDGTPSWSADVGVDTHNRARLRGDPVFPSPLLIRVKNVVLVRHAGLAHETAIDGAGRIGLNVGAGT